MIQKVELEEMYTDDDSLSLLISIPNDNGDLIRFIDKIVLYNPNHKNKWVLSEEIIKVSDNDILINVNKNYLESIPLEIECYLKVQFNIDNSDILINVAFSNKVKYDFDSHYRLINTYEATISFIKIETLVIISDLSLKEILHSKVETVLYNDQSLSVKLNNKDNLINIQEVYLKNRSSEIQISLEGNLFSEYTISYSKLKYEGIWDLYAYVDFLGVSKCIRIHTEEIILPPKTVLVNLNEEWIFRKIRPYSSNDLYFSLLISSKETFVNHIDYVVVEEEGIIEIKGWLDVFDYNSSFKLLGFSLIEETTCTEYYLENCEIVEGSRVQYIVVIEKSFFENLNCLNESYEFRINILTEYKKLSLPLVSNYDGINPKSKIVKFPEIIFKNEKYIFPYSIKPKYSANETLQLSACPISGIYLVESNITAGFLVLKIYVPTELIKYNLNLQLSNETENFLIEPEPGSLEYNYYKIPVNKIISSYKTSLLISQINEKLPVLMGPHYKQAKSKSILLSTDINTKQIKIDSKNIKNKVLLEFKWEISKLFAKTIKKFHKRSVWLVGENLGEVAQDNGVAFFEYCVNSQISEQVFFVSKKNNKNLDRLMPYKKNVLFTNTLKHMIFYNLSKYNIVSHGIRDVMPENLYSLMNQNQKSVIYLQHGITAMKKLLYSKNSYNNKIKKFVVCSQFEKYLFKKYMNFRDDQLIVTGFSRFDLLSDSSLNIYPRKLLIMPTWRTGIANSYDSFINSSFYKSYGGFLNSKKLHQLLEKYNLILEFYPHIELQRNKRCLELFENLHDNINLVTTSNKTVKNLLEESSLMITDYSSVAFDFGYMDKPVIFFQFDLDEYLLDRGSYVDLEKDLIGPVYYKYEELVEGIEQYIINNFEFGDHYRIKLNNHIEYRDKFNSKRIYNEIINSDH